MDRGFNFSGIASKVILLCLLSLATLPIATIAQDDSSTSFFISTKILDESGNPLSIPQAAGVVAVPTAPNKYIVTTFAGNIHLLTLDTSTYKQTEPIFTITLPDGRSALGVSSDPFNPHTYYVTNYIAQWQSRPGIGSGGWYNGQVVKVVLSDDQSSLRLDGIIASGLPVLAARGTGVGSAIINPLNRRLYVSIGTFTNGGVANPAEGNLEDCLLSSSILEVDVLSNGLTRELTWSSNNSGSATLTTPPSESGIRLWTTGVRSPLQLGVYTDNNIYTVDGGANVASEDDPNIPPEDFGPKSLTCTTSEPFTRPQPDRIIRLRPNQWYGHPNRARKQCTFVSSLEPQISFPGFTPPLTTSESADRSGILTSALAGHTEYTANWFRGKFRGQLFASENEFDANEGANFTPGTFALDLKTKVFERVADVGGVQCATDARGSFLVGQVFGGAVGVAVPTTKAPPKGDGIVIGVVFPTLGVPGSKIFITGYNFPEGVKVLVGGRKCRDVKRIDDQRLECAVPRVAPWLYNKATTVAVGNVRLMKAFRVLGSSRGRRGLRGHHSSRRKNRY